MGIRCVCPNGHRLHVKAELAGKRGVCPVCKVKFLIPNKSMPEPAAAPATAAPAAANEPATAAPSPAAEPARTVDPPSVEIPVEPAAATPAPGARPTPARPTPARAIPKAKPKPPEPPAEETPPPAPAPAEPPEPVADWYARPPGGEQLGPATEEVLKEWLAGGLLTADSYVWRTGWDDWKRVDQATADLPQVATTGAPLIPTPAAPPAGPSAAQRYAKRRQRSGKRQLVGVAVLAIATLSLGGVLAWVLVTKQGANADSTAAEAPLDDFQDDEFADPAKDAEPVDAEPMDNDAMNEEPRDGEPMFDGDPDDA